MLGQWEVMVGNVGFAHRGMIENVARKEFNDWVAISKASLGKASGENVTLFSPDGEIAKEYIGKLSSEYVG